VSVAGREEFLAGMHVSVLGRPPDARRLGLVPQPAGRPAHRPLVAQGRSDGPPQASGQGLILIARGDLSPLQNILFGAA